MSQKIYKYTFGLLILFSTTISTFCQEVRTVKTTDFYDLMHNVYKPFYKKHNIKKVDQWRRDIIPANLADSLYNIDTLYIYDQYLSDPNIRKHECVISSSICYQAEYPYYRLNNYDTEECYAKKYNIYYTLKDLDRIKSGDINDYHDINEEEYLLTGIHMIVRDNDVSRIHFVGLYLIQVELYLSNPYKDIVEIIPVTDAEEIQRGLNALYFEPYTFCSFFKSNLSCYKLNNTRPHIYAIIKCYFDNKKEMRQSLDRYKREQRNE